MRQAPWTKPKPAAKSAWKAKTTSWQTVMWLSSGLMC